ncbi:hypothetical protein niasHT_009427 [Heterodera trifolii]|uniref:Uncharacterized protein n=1 Tax=Heterodera trifolii TaxID=157864 RepID=A0ABD2MEK9_9BILA
MLSSVRFSSVSLPNRSVSPSRGSKECQTAPLYFASIGTDPIRKPEKATQTESQQFGTAEETISIREELVDLIMEELERAEKEEELMDEYERKVAFEEEQKGGGRGVQLRHLSQLELPEMVDDHFVHSSVVLCSVHCGPGNRISLLFGFPQHDIWCSGHLGAQILIVGTRRGQRGRVSTVPLSACPSTAEFARFGELLIVGTHSGELLLFSSESGDLLWSSESSPVMTHSLTVTQLRWAKEREGREQQRELISLSLDGTVRKSRLETDNRLELLQSVNFTLADLPRELRKGTADGGTKLGLIGCDFVDEANLLVATETGIILSLDMNGLTLLNTFAIGDSPEGIEQFAVLRPNQSHSVDEWHLPTQIIWRTSADGIIRCCPLRQQKPVPKETEMVPLPHSRENFHICIEHGILLIIGGSERRELIAWEIRRGEKMALPTEREGGNEWKGRTEGVGGRGNTLAVVTAEERGRKRTRTLTLYELGLTDDTEGQGK